MELKHSFTVPAPLEETWAAFGDLASIAECFPGATVTESDGETFKGTAKVKLGPVALQYTGHGQILDRDESLKTMRLEAKGKDKRGNGTAGATVAMAFASSGEAESTVDVTTDLAITGKPAQFGARMMQEVSDKLLGQFVECLQGRVGGGEGEAVETAAPAAPAPTPPAQATTPSVVPPSGGPGPSTPAPAASGPAPAAAVSTASPSAGGAPVSGGGKPAGADDALDLGATVLPVLLKMYGKQIAAGLGLLVVILWLWRRRD